MERDDASSDRGRMLRHELRTPLNQIIGYSELLIDEANDGGSSSIVPDLEKITRAARTMLSLLDTFFENQPAAAPSTAKAEAVPAAPRPSREPAPPPAGAGRSILVVDDDPANIEFVARQLERHGYRVETATSGEAALAAVGRQLPDLVLLDVMMPGMSGLEVLTRLRILKGPSELPVIMATALNQSDDVVEALRSGANDYVTKPLDLPVVLARLDTQLQLKLARERIDLLASELSARNALLRKTFGRFLDDEVVTALLETPEGLRLGGVRTNLTVLISDLRGFTSISEELGPEDVVAVLNDYLASMVEVVERNRGTILEFIGDAILVVFGAPLQAADDPRRAVRCALEMQKAMAQVNERLAARGVGPLEMGIGLNSGEVIAGNIGSLKRSRYNVIGRHVNLASRIESYTVGGQVLASRATVDAAGEDVQVAMTTEIRAKGFRDPISVFEVIGLRSEGLVLDGALEQLTPMTPPVSVRVTQLEGKFLGTVEHTGALSALSSASAELTLTVALQPFSDLRLRLPAFEGSSVEEDVYARVLEKTAEGRYRIRFTSNARTAAALLASVVASGPRAGERSA